MSQPATTQPGTTGYGHAGLTEPRRRLHPLTPLLRGANLIAVVIAAISWQGYQDLGLRGWVLAVAGAMVLVLAGSVVSWLVTGYHVVGRELRIYEGFLWRRTRAIPLERLQSVELVRPLLARLTGLAELRLEVVGASKTEAPLAFLTVSDAVRLRARLLAIGHPGERPTAARADAPHSADTPYPTRPRYPAGATHPAGAAWPRARAADQPEHVIHEVAIRDLVISQLLRPQWWALPLAIAAPIFLVAYENDITFIGIASTLTAVIGVIQAPVRVLLGDWKFTIATADDGLRLRRGLIETRSQTVPPGRVQAVEVQWPLLWRGLGWVRAHMKVAGVSPDHRSELRAGSLVPVADVPTTERVVAQAVPGFTLTSIVVRPVPARAHVVAPLRSLVLGYQLTDAAFVARDGLLTRRVVIVAYSRIQSVRIHQGPLQRILRLASVWVDTAGAGLQAVAPHRGTGEARALALELAARSRAARITAGGSGIAPEPRQAPTAW